jgi:hypothetical protein
MSARELGGGLVEENGAVFTREEADGAPISNGTRVIKVCSEDEDARPNGAEGVVIGSLEFSAEDRQAQPPHLRHVQFAYFVAWDSEPDLPVGILDFKVVAK